MDRRVRWQNPEMIGEHKLSGRNLALPFDEHDEYSYDASPAKISLNGQWRFLWQMDLRGGVSRDYARADFDDSAWDLTPVPSVWQMEGYGKPFYICSSMNQKIVSVKKREIPTIYPEKNEAGVYRRSFTLPDWDPASRVILHFGAAKSALEVYVNGQYAGYSQGAMTPAEFDVTQLLVPGENQLTAVVYRFSTGYYLENQDMWNFSGIYREVYLVAEPEVSIYDFFADTSLTDDFTVGTLDASVVLFNKAKKDRQVSVSVYVDGKCYASKSVIAAAGGDTQVVFARQEFPELALWTAETPELYSFSVVLRGETGQFISKKRIRIGFRRVDIQGNVLRVNGRRVVIKGVNRHDFDPDHGWAVPRERYYDDLYLMKRANINAIRTAHYPDDAFFYELCDELGFYVMDEADVESHGTRRKNCPGDHPQWRAAVCDRAQRMVLRDRSHACVCFWSLGNEAGDGKNFIYEREAILALDRSRPIHYEGDMDYTKSDFISRMYPVESLVELMRQQKEFKTSLFDNIANSLAADNKAIPGAAYADHPVMYCEFAHAMENSLGNFREYVEDFDKYEHMCGGFIWDYVDQSIRVNAAMQTDCPPGSWVYGGDFDEGYSSYYFCANGIIGADRVPHPSYYETKQCYANVCAEGFDAASQKVTLRNKSPFAPLRVYEIHWQLSRDGERLQQGALDFTDAAPGETTTETVPYDLSQVPPGGELLLTISFRLRKTHAWAPSGYEMCFNQFTLSPWQLPALPPEEELFLQRQGSTIHLHSKQLKVSFERGRLCSLDFGDGELLAADLPVKRRALRPNFYRALTDNDIGYLNFAPQFARFSPLRIWRGVSNRIFALYTKAERLSAGCVRLRVNWNPTGPAVGMRSTFTIHGNGVIEVEHRARGLFLPMLKIGMRMGLDLRLQKAQWYGRGPFEAHCDRKTGQKIRLHEMSIAELEHRYMRPQENGNREDVRRLRITGEDGRGLQIDAASLINFSAGYYSQETLDDAKHLYELIPDDYVTLNIDGFQRGVGGDMPGNAYLHAPYKLKARRYAYGFTMRRAE